MDANGSPETNGPKGLAKAPRRDLNGYATKPLDDAIASVAAGREECL